MERDVHQVEIQNKGMQITSENKLNLLSHLDQLMVLIQYFLHFCYSQESLKIPGSVIETLKNEPLDVSDGVKQCEKAILKLSNVIKTDFKGLYFFKLFIL